MNDDEKRLHAIALEFLKEGLKKELNYGVLESLIDIDRWEWKARLDNHIAMLGQGGREPELVQDTFMEIAVNAMLGYIVTQLVIESETGEQAEPSDEEEDEDTEGPKYRVTPVHGDGISLSPIEVESREEALELARAISTSGYAQEEGNNGAEFVYFPAVLWGCRIEPITEE